MQPETVLFLRKLNTIKLWFASISHSQTFTHQPLQYHFSNVQTYLHLLQSDLMPYHGHSIGVCVSGRLSLCYSLSTVTVSQGALSKGARRTAWFCLVCLLFRVRPSVTIRLYNENDGDPCSVHGSKWHWLRLTMVSQWWSVPPTSPVRFQLSPASVAAMQPLPDQAEP